MSDFHIKAMLQCGVTIEVRQPGESQTLELTISPKEGEKIESTAWIKDGVLRVNAEITALAGLYQFLGIMFVRPRKKFLGVVLGGFMAKEPTVINSSSHLIGFRLMERSLKEDTPQYPYVMGRQEVHRFMLAEPWVTLRFQYSVDGERESSDGMRTENSIRLGCQRFTGQDYIKLRRWALAARRKS